MTSAGRFSEKAEMFPNSVFIIGADTLVRVFDEKFYLIKKIWLIISRDLMIIMCIF